VSLLRASSQAAGLQVDIDAVVDPASEGDAGVDCGSLLLAFATSAQRQHNDLTQRREALTSAVGEDGLTDAAATVAIFSGLVRVADGTGIQLDDGALADSADYRDRLGVNAFGGAQNSTTDVEAMRAVAVADLFG
jgi:hypothetical protein